MQLQVQRKSDSQLPLIDVIPDFPIAQLEGYNGVGKSLTVRLLEICSGRRPLLTQEAWSALCQGLGHVIVTATKLRGARKIYWEIDGERLLAASERDDAPTQPELDWFVSVKRDDKKVGSLDEIRALFAVQRIAGEIGLVDTLAIEMDQARLELSSVSASITQLEKLGEVEAMVEEAAAILESVSPRIVLQRSALALETRLAREELSARYQEAVKRRENLDEIASVEARLKEIAATGEELDAEISKLEDEIAKLREQIDETAKQLKAAEEGAAKSGEIRDQLKKMTKSYERAVTEISNRSAEIVEARQLANLAEGADPEERRAELLAEMQDAQRRRNELEAGPAISNLIDKMAPGIDGAIASGLGDQVLIAGDSHENAWTVSEVSAALGRRKGELAASIEPVEATRLDERIANLRTALEALDSLKEIERKLKVSADRKKRIEEELEELDKQLDAEATEKIDDLRASRRALDEEMYAASAQLTMAAHRRDGLGSPAQREALAERFKALLSDAGITARQIAGALADAEKAASDLRDETSTARLREREAGAEAERDLAALKSIINSLRNEGRFRWIAGSSAALPDADDPVETQLKILEGLVERVRSADTTVSGLRTLFPGLEQGLQAVSKSLHGIPAESLATFRVDEITQWLEDWATEWFRGPEVSEALFGPGASDIEVDLAAKQVSWSAPSGESHNKPFEGLSSGEQAFAFTQASLSLFQRSPVSAKNRLIALDEFGAFVSHDKLSRLFEFLQHWQSEHEGDQVLLILPANKDYAALASAASGDDAERYSRMAEQLAEQSWFVEEFVG